MRPPDKTGPPRGTWPEGVLAVVTGIWLSIGLLKFGNPVIFDDKVAQPEGLSQWLIQPWPMVWGYLTFVPVAIAGLFVWRGHTRVPKWIVGLPLTWFCWQLAAATQTVDVRLTRVTLLHFAVCVVCFYLGLFALSRVRDMTALWLAWIVGYGLVLALGFEQHFGGLEETRRWFVAYQLPNLQQAPSPEFMQKLASDRIYSTLFYPNTLAGVILLLTPVAVTCLAAARQLTMPARSVLVGAVSLASLGCLYWSGSKAGWLLALLVAVVAFLQWPIRKPIKAGILCTLVFAGLAGFALRHGGYVSRGAKSATSRFDYWRVAVQVVKRHPVLGSGPGTFGVVHRQLKSPQTEMARLAHNDYLQQGSDAGLLGFLGYSGLVAGSIGSLYRRRWAAMPQCGVWLGLFGLALQGVVEFGLYIPALAWPQFLFLGWLWGRDCHRLPSEPPIISPSG